MLVFRLSDRLSIMQSFFLRCLSQQLKVASSPAACYFYVKLLKTPGATSVLQALMYDPTEDRRIKIKILDLAKDLGGRRNADAPKPELVFNKFRNVKVPQIPAGLTGQNFSAFCFWNLDCSKTKSLIPQEKKNQVFASNWDKVSLINAERRPTTFMESLDQHTCVYAVRGLPCPFSMKPYRPAMMTSRAISAQTHKHFTAAAAARLYQKTTFQNLIIPQKRHGSTGIQKQPAGFYRVRNIDVKPEGEDGSEAAGQSVSESRSPLRCFAQKQQTQPEPQRSNFVGTMWTWSKWLCRVSGNTFGRT